MKILAADKFPESARATLVELGHDVDLRPATSADELPSVLAQTDPDVLIVRSTKVTATALEAASRLSLIIRAGAGVNTIDLSTASRRGVFVANCPGKNAIAVAELTMGLLLAIDRDIPAASAELAGGRWNKKKYGRADGLYGKRLGLIGLGAIARHVASRAQAFGLSVSAWTPTLDESRASRYGVGHFGRLDDLLRECDVVSVHVPLTDDTRHLIGEHELGLMKSGAVLLHTSRGGVVDDAALARAVSEGRVRAGVDVFEGEPGSGTADFDNALARAPGLYATPHIGASTRQAELAIADEVTDIIREYVESGAVRNAVNLVVDRPGRHAIVVRHLDQVGVLAGVLQSLRREQLNVKEMENVIFTGNEAACATIIVERAPSEKILTDLREHDSVIAVDLRSTSSRV
jgi:D-3-phosphoglycerate dehydrogenase